MTTPQDLLQQGISAAQASDFARAIPLLTRAVQADPSSEQGWLWLGKCLTDPRQREYCLRRVLALNPNQPEALRLLQPPPAAAPPAAALRAEPPARVEPAPSVAAPPRAEPRPEPAIEQPVEQSVAAQPNRLLQFVILVIKRLFGAPRLPFLLTFLALLIIITDVLFALLQQPASYWTDYYPLLYLGGSLVYLVGVGIALSLLTRRLALVVWLAISFAHLEDSFSMFNRGALLGLNLTRSTGSILQTSLVIGISVALGVALSYALFTVQGEKPGRLGTILGWAGRLVVALLSLAWLGLLGFSLYRTVDASQMSWQPIIPETLPPGRVDGMMAYDLDRNKAVLFGGATDWLGGDEWLYVADTWEWDGANWKQMSPEKSPAERLGHGLAYDETRKVVVLFGGKNKNGLLNDTWEWDGTNWREACVFCKPAPRDGHQMIFDPRRGKVVMYGGYGGGDVYYGEAWEWDGTDWSAIPQESSPVASSFSLIYDPVNERALGFLAGSPSGLWAWDKDNKWSKLNLSAGPSPRPNTDLVYDPVSKQALLFGGYKAFGDTWLFDGSAWQEVKSPRSPLARWGHTMFYDRVRQRIVLFGGFDTVGGKYLNDMWEYVMPAKTDALSEPEATPTPGENPTPLATPVSQATPTQVDSFIDPVTGVQIICRVEESMFPSDWRYAPNSVHVEPVAASEIERSIRVVRAALQKYPPELVQKTLKKVYVVSSLVDRGVGIGGTYYDNTVYLVNGGGEANYTDYFIERAFHEEYSSILYKLYPTYLNTHEWAAVNPAEFVYSGSGFEAIKEGKAGLSYDPTLLADGFVNRYATSQLENDFNAIASRLFAGEADLWAAAEKYQKIQQKIALTVAFYAQIDPLFTEDYFKSQQP